MTCGLTLYLERERGLGKYCKRKCYPLVLALESASLKVVTPISADNSSSALLLDCKASNTMTAAHTHKSLLILNTYLPIIGLDCDCSTIDHCSSKKAVYNMGAVCPTPSLPLRKALKCILLCPEEESDLDQEGWVCTFPPQDFCRSLTLQ